MRRFSSWISSLGFGTRRHRIGDGGVRSGDHEREPPGPRPRVESVPGAGPGWVVGPAGIFRIMPAAR